MASRGSIDLTKALISLGAQVYSEGGRLNTALSAASYKGHGKMVKKFLQRVTDPNKHSGDFPNALSAAIYQNNHDLVTVLIKAGVELNAQDPHYGIYCDGCFHRVRLNLKNRATQQLSETC